MNRKLSMLLLVALGFLVGSTLSAYPPDKIGVLPGADFRYDFNQYSGYLSGSTDGNIQLHYWFVESQVNPNRAPLVLWLNGGPGCSSVDGLLEENGPFSLQPDSTLLPNPYAWNQLANVIYLESPACVGYSYAVNGNCTVNDDGTAEQNYQALLSFYDKFPEYADSPFYITGESYAGIYIPTLATRVMESSSKLRDNLKGLAVGNGLLSYNLNYNTLLTFGYAHSLVSSSQWESLNAACCSEVRAQCDFNAAAVSSLKCSAQVTKALASINNPNLLQYDIYEPCWHSANSSGAFNKMMSKLRLQRGPDTPAAAAALGDSGIPCENVTAAESYMNSPAVREALHINPELGQWQVCSTFGYRQQYTDMTSTYANLLNYDQLHILFYHGDVDAVCNFIEGQQFVNEKLGLASTSSWGNWKLVNGQIAGWQQSYGPNVQFTTVKDAGHEVPTYKPAFALEMFSAFLRNDYTYPAPL